MLPVQERKPATQAANLTVKEIEQTQITPVAPTGLQLVSLHPSQDDAPPPASDTKQQRGSGSGSSDGGATGGITEKNKKDADEKDKDKDKEKKEAREQKTDGGDKKDEKPRKNYCN